MTIRKAGAEDANILVELILQLADYERLRHDAAPDAAALAEHLREDARPRCEAFIAESNAGDPAGFALFYHHYSTFKTNWGVYLEDLFVLPGYRKQGIGFALLKEVARVAVERNCVRLEWQVLDWNELAIGFYEQIGAVAMDDWITMRLTGEALHRLGREVQ